MRQLPSNVQAATMTESRSLPISEPRRLQAQRVAVWGNVFLIVVVIGMVGLLGRVVQLKLAPDSRLAAAVGSPMSTRKEMASRGDLLDAAGRVIATSTVAFRLFVDPESADDPTTLALDLAPLIKTDLIELDRKIAARPNSRYVVVKDVLQDWQVEAIKKARLKGVGMEPVLVRHYPHSDLAAGIVGKVGFSHDGLAGFEKVFDAPMTPTMGQLTFLRDVRRQALWIDPQDYDPGKDGQDVRLSIDLVVQEIAEKRLRRAVEEFNAGGGRMIVMDCRTGGILAMTDVLNYRPGWTEQIEDKFREIHPSLGRNRCVADPYEPGSTFKPFIWAVATELGKARLDEELQTPAHTGWRTSYGRMIHDAHYYGPMTWRMVLVKSLNSGMAMVAERMSHREMQEALRRFGFGAKTNCGIPGETAGIVTSPRKWGNYTQSSVAMGHEIAVTPLQMVRAFSAFCRDGTLPAMHVVSPQFAESRSPNQLRISRQAIPPAIVRTAREAMRGVMEEGTGRLAQSEKYQMFGKSGTAELPRKDRRGYHRDRYVASFIAGAPFEEPHIVVLCVIDDPDKKKGHYGGALAGPVVRDVIDETLSYLGVAPDIAPKDEGKALVSAE